MSDLRYAESMIVLNDGGKLMFEEMIRDAKVHRNNLHNEAEQARLARQRVQDSLPTERKSAGWMKAVIDKMTDSLRDLSSTFIRAQVNPSMPMTEQSESLTVIADASKD